jgi:hypothetical protein
MGLHDRAPGKLSARLLRCRRSSSPPLIIANALAPIEGEAEDPAVRDVETSRSSGGPDDRDSSGFVDPEARRTSSGPLDRPLLFNQQPAITAAFQDARVWVDPVARFDELDWPGRDDRNVAEAARRRFEPAAIDRAPAATRQVERPRLPSALRTGPQLLSEHPRYTAADLTGQVPRFMLG